MKNWRLNNRPPGWNSSAAFEASPPAQVALLLIRFHGLFYLVETFLCPDI